jgi:thiamine-phosphate pyrophosphorylase
VKALRGLYPIVNIAKSEARTLEPIVRTFADVGVPLLQLRAKHATHDERLALVERFLVWLRGTGTELVVNDDVLAAVTAGAPWVHVGQGDTAVAEIRRRHPMLRVGVSTHSVAQVDVALAVQPDYVAYGPVFPTRSKDNPEPVVGVDGLRTANERAREHAVPLVAIGGISLDNTVAIADHASMVAIISALENTDNLRTLASDFHRRFGG